MLEKKLSTFFPQEAADAEGWILRGSQDALVRGLEFDSRRVQKDFLFVAFPGTHTDGHRFIPQAESSGASVILHSRSLENYAPEITYLQTPDPRRAFSQLAAAFYDHPSRSIPTIGVTGTDGKSTTVSFLHQLLTLAGRRSGFISTVAFETGRGIQKNALRQSTPEANQIHQLLKEMVDHGLDVAVLESTSHGLSQKTHRLEDVQYSAAVFTNVTREHLEFHGTLENYRQAKARLFQFLDKDKAPLGASQKPWGVVNLDDPHHGLYTSSTRRKCWTYSLKSDAADLRAQITAESPSGTSFILHWAGKKAEGRLPIPGTFNVENLLAALLAIAPLLGRSPLDLLPLAEKLQGVKGRMKPVILGQPFHALVDYAHTPGSFQKLFPMIKGSTQGRLIAVFGSAGDRDVEKRPLQGEIAGHHADILILTNEDPRGEDPRSILEEIQAGVRDSNCQVQVIPNRQEAINQACALAQAGDTVICLGKGHEQSIEFPDGHHPWDEESALIKAIQALGFGL
jgi:UDP-N-acetylmuramoyl-L-alanyl-D-glutamate--2,6-diaminopimelate ligase